MIARPPIACLGAGRMGRGIAVVFAYAGHKVTVVDFKAREPAAFARLAAEATRRPSNCDANAAGASRWSAASHPARGYR